MIFRLLVVLLVTSCGKYNPVKSVLFPKEKRAIVHVPETIDINSNQLVSFDGFVFNTTQVGSVFFDDLSVCDAADVVFSKSLSVNYSCSANGTVSLDVASSSPKILLEVFLTTIRSIGVKYVISDGVIILSGGSVKETSTGSDINLQSSGSSEVDILTSSTIPFSFKRALASESFIGFERFIKFLPTVEGVQSVQSVIDLLAINVFAVQQESSIYLIGLKQDIELVVSAIKLSDKVTLPIYLTSLSLGTEEILNQSFPLVKFNFDPVVGILYLHGFRSDVLSSYAVVRENYAVSRDILISAVFVSFSDLDSLDFSIDGDISFSTDDLIFSTGAVLDASLVSAFLNHSVSKGSATVLSKPSLTVSSGRNASFLSGDRVPVLSSFSDDGGQAVTYHNSGISLEVAPVLLSSGLLKLALSLEVTSVTGEGVGGNPVFSTRSISTTVEISDGDVVSLSGLQGSTNSASFGKNLLIFPVKSVSGEASNLAFFVTAKLL